MHPAIDKYGKWLSNECAKLFTMKKLLNPSDDSLDFAFAAVVAGIAPDSPDIGGDPLRGLYCGDSGRRHVPRFTRSMDAVLPWISKQSIDTGAVWSITVYLDGSFMVNAGHQDENSKDAPSGEDKSLPRACVIALLRAHGVEVEFTP
jgi:hypothetical protein